MHAAYQKSQAELLLGSELGEPLRAVLMLAKLEFCTEMHCKYV